MEKLYPPQDPRALGKFYLRHLSAMTSEGLDGKAEIAEQLAWRDQRIAKLEALRDSTADWLRGIADGRYWDHREAAQCALNLIQAPQDGDNGEW